MCKALPRPTVVLLNAGCLQSALLKGYSNCLLPKPFSSQRYEAEDARAGDGKLLTDGAGKMLQSVADAVASELGAETCKEPQKQR